MMKKVITFLSICGFFISCNSQSQYKQEDQTIKKVYPITKTEAEWKKQLTDFEFYVIRTAGTERPFTGKYYKYNKKGIYHCKACDAPLYSGNHKFNSHTGWPSFYQAIKNGVDINIDRKLGYIRKELLCNKCGGHLGHVFNDGPKPTGMRHCINSISLQFKAKINE